MIKGFLFANNLLLDTRKTLKRTDSVRDVIYRKLDHLVNECQEKELALVLTGSVFTKSFCVKTLSDCLDRFQGIDCMILADKTQMSGTELNPQSTLGLLNRAGVVRAIYGNEISRRVDVSTGEGEVTYGIVGNRHDVANDEIIVDQGLFNDMECVYIGDFLADLNFSGGTGQVKPYEVNNCALVIASGVSTECLDAKVGKTLWAIPGNVVRHKTEQETLAPSFITFAPDEGVKFFEISHDEFVFDHAGLEESVIEASFEKSNFARKLKEECSNETAIQGGVDQATIDRLCQTRNVSQAAREVIYNLEQRYHATK